jgi:hypothetical protein
MDVTRHIASFSFYIHIHGQLELQRFAATSAGWGEAAPLFRQDPLWRQALGG